MNWTAYACTWLAMVPATLQAADITGRAVNSVTGAAVARAALSIAPLPGSPGTTSFATTEADGTFRMTGLAAGAYRLRTERNGFLTTHYGGLVPEEPGAVLYLNEGQSQQISVSMIPHGVLAVEVFDEQGEALHTATVQVLRSVFAAGRRRTVPIASGRTNDLGQLRVAGLAPGNYYVAATPPPANLPIAKRDQGEQADGVPGPTFFPSATDLGRAALVKLPPGGEQVVPVTIARSLTYRIRGRLPEQLANGGTALVLVPRQGPVTVQNPVAQIQKGGEFEITGVLPGSYVLNAVGSPDGGPARTLARGDINVVERDAEGVVLTPIVAVTLKGRVRIEGEEITKLAGVRMAVEPLDPLPGTAGAILATISPDGSFEILSLPQGRYRLRPQSVAGTYIKQAKFGERDALETSVDLLDMPVPPEFEFTLNRKPVSLEVIVDRPLDRDAGTIIIVPDPYRPSELPLPVGDAIVVMPDQDGYSITRDLAPGAYRAFAFEHFDPTQDLDPAVLDGYAQWSGRITLSEGQTGRVAVKWIGSTY